MVRMALQVLSQLLEMAGIGETGKAAEEMLAYLKATVTLEPTATLLCVQQVSATAFSWSE